MTEQELIKRVLDLIIRNDPRTCPKIDARVMSQQEIDKAYRDGSDAIFGWSEIVSQIHALYKEAGYVKTMQDQRFPEMADIFTETYQIQKDYALKMYEAGWRQVEEAK